MKPRMVFPIMALLSILALPQLVGAVAVHTFDCKNCHIPALSVTALGDGNVCVRCHYDTQSIPLNDGTQGITNSLFESKDASNALGHNTTYNVAGLGETSHNWSAADTQTAAGAMAPIKADYSQFYSRYGSSTGRVTCSRCHNPHADHANPQLLILGAGSTETMCIACHAPWNKDNSANYTFITHPVNVTYNSAQVYYNTTSPPPNDGTINTDDGITLYGGKVVCGTCHQVHFADSDPNTPDIPTNYNSLSLNGGDGKLLRSYGRVVGDSVKTSTLCKTCHEYSTHEGQHAALGCLDCHSGHSPSGNYNMLRPQVTSLGYVPKDNGDPGDSDTLLYTTLTAPWKNGGTGYCEGCHAIPLSVAQHNVATAGKAECQGCHNHASDSFTSACNACHGYAPAADDEAATGYSGVESTTPHKRHANGSGNYTFDCAQCHYTVTDVNTAPHKDNLFQDVFFSYNTASGALAWTDSSNPSYLTGAPGTCSSVYCHSNGGPRGGTITYNTVTWANSAGTITTGGVTDCTACHGNDSATMTARSNSATHQKHLAKGYGCNVCHSSTATSNTAVDIPAGNHVNGAVEVTYNSAYSLGAGTLGPGLPYDNAAGTCGIYCHSNGAGTNATPDWDVAASGACGTCHKLDVASGTPMTSGSHTAHIDDSDNEVGRDLGCIECHSNTVDDANTIGNQVNHVDGDVTIGIRLDSDKTSCASISCHSNGNFDGTVVYKTIGTDVVWGSTPLSGCDDCHGDGAGKSYPIYDNGGPGVDANSHAPHVAGSGIDCEICHAGTATANALKTGGTDLHVNGAINVSFSEGGSASFGGGTCSNISCHGTGTPQWGGTAECGTCHAANYTLPASHSTHYNSAVIGDRALDAKVDEGTTYYVYQCGSCHNGVPHADGTKQVAMSASWGGTIDGSKICSSVYCHSDGAGTAGTNPQWGVTVMTCGSCHAANPATARHPVHVNDANYNLRCAECHAVTATDAADASVAIADKFQHVDKTKDINWGTRSAGGDVYVDAATACSNIYCHSDGNGGAGNTAVRWDTDPATWDCGSCHDVRPATQRHSEHVDAATYNFSCAECHVSTTGDGVSITGYPLHANKIKDVVWGAMNSGGTAYVDAATACDNIYCHSNGRKASQPYTSGTAVMWNTATSLSCGNCHGNSSTIATNAHASHLFGNQSSLGMYTYCATCHDATAAGSTAIRVDGYDKHVNKLINVKFSTLVTKVYNADLPTFAADPTTDADGATRAPDSAAGSCANVYCHSVGNLDATGNVVAIGSPEVGFKTVVWDTATFDCADCHGDGTVAYPVYASGTAGSVTANSHVKHVGGSGILCSTCHQTTTASNSIDPTVMTVVLPGDGGRHLDRLETVVYNATVVGASATYDATVDNKTCSNLYCHGSGTPQWGGAALDCNSCHSANNTLENSHGAHYQSATAVTANTTTNAATQAEYVFACGNCHNSGSTTHAGGAVSAVQAAEVSLADFTAAGTTAAASPDRGFNYTAGTCGTNACHNDGTAAKGAPNTAAAWAGSLGTECTGCHDNNKAADGASGLKTMATGAHDAHVADGTIMSDKACQSCHSLTVSATDRAIADKREHVDGTRDVHILATWDSNAAPADNWTAGTVTCNNVYCHSDGKAAPTYKSVVWTTPINDCVSCHQGASAGTTLSGAHQAHVVNATTTIGRTLGCADCHSTTVDNNTHVSTPANHVDGNPDYMSCAAIYCHSNGNYDGTVGVTYLYKPPTWTANYACDDCHGDGAGKTYPTYANAGVGVNANSHEKHVVGASAKCGECHAETSTGNGTAPNLAIDGSAPAQHVDNSIDVSGAKIGSFSGGTCSSIACHGGNDADWGETLGCRDCHGDAGADTDNFVYNDGTFAKVAIDEWSYSGHGKLTTAQYDVTNRNGANFDKNGAADIDGCLYCHDGSIGHSANDGTNNYFRLHDNGQADLNGACLGCHATGSTGVDPDGAGTVYASKNSTIKIDKYHGGAKHNGTDRDAGRWCWDCHDPHGDTTAADVAATTNRIQMIQKRAAVNPNAMGVPASLTDTDIVFFDRTLGVGAGAFARDIDDVAAAAGVCNNCHTVTAQYRQNLGAEAHSTAQCTSCHQHSTDSAYNGNAFQASCNGCHGSSAGNYWPDGSGGVMPSANSAGRHDLHMEVLSYRVYGEQYNTALLTTTVNGTADAKQRALCEFCHAAVSNDGDHGLAANLPAEVFADFNSVRHARNMWDGADAGTLIADDPGNEDDATYNPAGDGNKGTCTTTDCHNNKATPAGYSWYGANTSACIMCHSLGGTNNPASGLHNLTPSVTGVTHDDSFGSGGTCASCHNSMPTIGNTAASTHMNGAFTGNGSVSGDLTAMGLAAFYSNSGSDNTGSCAATSCHLSFSDDWAHVWTSAAGYYTTNTTACEGCHGDKTTAFNTGVLHRDRGPHTSGTTYGCASCHVLEEAGYTFAWSTNDWAQNAGEATSKHGNATVEVNSNGITYNQSTGLCTTCHTSADGVHNFQDTSWTIASLSGTAITCTSCHNTSGTSPALRVSSTSSHVFANGSTFGNCTDCHASHADSTAAGANVIYVPTTYGSSTPIPTMTTGGGGALYSASPHNYRIRLGGNVKNGGTFSTEAEWCWGCHDTVTVNRYTLSGVSVQFVDTSTTVGTINATGIGSKFPVGRWISVSGSSQAANNRTFKVATAAANSITVTIPTGAARLTAVTNATGVTIVSPVSEWQVNDNGSTGSLPYNYGSVTSSNWVSATWSSGKGADFDYKTSAIQSTHAANYGGTSTAAVSAGNSLGFNRTETKDNVANIRCSYCHDVHGTHDTINGDVAGEPYLRGTWKGNPYPEDGAPRSGWANWSREGQDDDYGLVPRGSAARANTGKIGVPNLGGYWIDQNTDNPNNGATATGTSGLCDLCHGSTKDGTWSTAELGNIDQVTGEGLWISGYNGHTNVVLGGAGRGTDGSTESSARNIFTRTRRGSAVRDAATTSNNDRVDMGLGTYSSGWGEAFRGNYLGSYQYYPRVGSSTTSGSGAVRPYAYGYFAWNNAYNSNGSSTHWISSGTMDLNVGNITVTSSDLDTETANYDAQANYHTFNCGKCHNPHASRLPKLMITNCLDTNHNNWDNDYQAATSTNVDTVWRNSRLSQWPSAQNCHRLDSRASLNTSESTARGTGWNKATPWLEATAPD